MGPRASMDTTSSSAAASAGERECLTSSGPACQTCRYRKSRCDRRRPMCGVCQRLDTACEYRETLPPKYLDLPDRSLSDVLETLGRVERKIDTLSLKPSDHHDPDTAVNEEQGSPRFYGASQGDLRGAGHYAKPTVQQTLLAQLQKASEQLTIPHKVLLWPSVYADLTESQTPMALDMPFILREGSRWFARMEARKQPPTLSAGVGLRSIAVNSSGLSPGSSPNTMFPTLLPDQVRQCSAAYFDTSNLLYPILNRKHFTTNIQDRVLSRGYADGDAASVLLLLVVALGRVSIDGAQGAPISTIDGHASGFRGGSLEHPPGFAAFNEARRRFGFIAMECSLETVQILLLQMIYVESHARHLDFWRLATAASMAFQGLIKTQEIDWGSDHGEQVKRVFWTCAMNESFYHIDLDLPASGIMEWEDEISLPDFSRNGEDVTSTVLWIFHAQFLALIALRAVTGRVHDAMQNAEASVLRAHSLSNTSAPPAFVVRELGRQIDSWHAALPHPLRWSLSESAGGGLQDPTHTQRDETTALPTPNGVGTSQRQAFEVAAGQLQIRFYYARFMLYRAFVYKALHTPEKMTVNDAHYCGMAIRSACRWPWALHSARHTKRLFPHLFSWTQTCLGILLIFRLTNTNDCLRAICDEHVARMEILRATGILLDWLRDVRQLDGVADWCWSTVDDLLSSART